MKAAFSGLMVAFSLYSFIPVPQVQWEKNTMKFALGFLPLIGLIVGGLELFWINFSTQMGLNVVLYACIAALIPIFVSGGIHLDGFVDTSDALCSYGDREKRLAIMKDPHVGAFGVIYLVGLVVLQLGFYGQLFDVPAYAAVLLLGFVGARIAGGGMIVFCQCAKNSGLAHIFSENTEKTPVKIALIIELIACSVAAVMLGGIIGAAAITINVIAFLIHKSQCYKNFGGITGDLAGFFITISETLTLMVCVVGGILMR